MSKSVGLTFMSSFQSEITFPRLKGTAIGYDEILQKYDHKVIEGYHVHESDDHKYIYITQKVWNLSFVK